MGAAQDAALSRGDTAATLTDEEEDGQEAASQVVGGDPAAQTDGHGQSRAADAAGTDVVVSVPTALADTAGSEQESADRRLEEQGCAENGGGSFGSGTTLGRFGKPVGSSEPDFVLEASHDTVFVTRSGGDLHRDANARPDMSTVARSEENLMEQVRFRMGKGFEPGEIRRLVPIPTEAVPTCQSPVERWQRALDLASVSDTNDSPGATVGASNAPTDSSAGALGLSKLFTKSRVEKADEPMAAELTAGFDPTSGEDVHCLASCWGGGGLTICSRGKCCHCAAPENGLGIHFAIMSTFGALVAFCAVVLTISNAILAEKNRDTYSAGCFDALNATVYGSLAYQMSTAVSVVAQTAKSIAVDLSGAFASETFQIVGGTFNMISVLAKSGASLETINFSVLGIMYVQLNSSYVQFSTGAAMYSVNASGPGPVPGPGVPPAAANLTRYFQLLLEPNQTQGEVLSQAGYLFEFPPILGGRPPGSGLIQPGDFENSARDGVVACTVLDSSGLVSGNCQRNLTLDNVDFRSLVAQSASPPEQSAQGVWSNLLFVLKNSSNPTEPPGGLPGLARMAYGTTFSWPINVPTLTYEDFHGVLTCTMTVESLSQFCASALDVIHEAFSAEQRDDDMFSLYVVVRNDSVVGSDLEQSQVGWLAAAAVSSGPLSLGWAATATTIFDATGEGLAIQLSSLALLQHEGAKDFSDESFAVPRSVVVNTTDGTLCNLTAVDVLSLVNASEAYRECFVIASAPMNTMQSDLLPEKHSLQWLVIVSVPLNPLLERYIESLISLRKGLEVELAGTIQAQIKQQIAINVAITVCCVAGTLLAAWWLSGALARPIRRLEAFILRIKHLEFGLGVASNRPELGRTAIREVNNLQQSFLAMYAALDTFSRFVPASVVRGIVQSEKGRKINVRRRVVTIMFSDIQGFTSIAEELEIEDLLYLITRYLTAMTRIVESYEGVVAEIQGDGLLAFFNTPDDVEDHCSKALAAALAQQEYIKVLSKTFRDELGAKYSKSLSDFKVRIGIHTGTVLTGVIGSDLKMKWGCISRHLNTCSRLEGLCKLYGVSILCSEETLAGSRHREMFETRELDKVVVKGTTIPMTVHEVVGQCIPIESGFASNQVIESSEASDGGNAVASLRRRFRSFTGRRSKSSRRLSRLAEASSAEVELGSSPASAATGLTTGKLTSSKTYKVGRAMVVKSSCLRTFYPTCAESDESIHRRIRIYEEALEAFQAGKLLEAVDQLELLSPPSDVAESYLLQRVRDKLGETGGVDVQDEGWTGVNELTAKSF